MKIYVGSDHGGFELKNELIKYLSENDYEVIDKGNNINDADDDYNDFAELVIKEVAEDNESMGILICGTGIGMCMMANRNRKIRAAVCHSEFEAKMTRLHNNANVLCLGGRVIGIGLAKSIAEVFLNSEFSNEKRHIERVNKL